MTRIREEEEEDLPIHYATFMMMIKGILKRPIVKRFQWKINFGFGPTFDGFGNK